MKVYVASSWRCEFHQQVVMALRDVGFEVYDFTQPKPGNKGFHWSEIDPNWQNWTPSVFRESLSHQIAQDGFKLDRAALDSCDACILALPCGRSAHLELGYCAGKGKPTAVLMLDQEEPELMYLLCDQVCVSVVEVIRFLNDKNVKAE